jgi:hypothetical protein
MVTAKGLTGRYWKRCPHAACQADEVCAKAGYRRLDDSARTGYSAYADTETRADMRNRRQGGMMRQPTGAGAPRYGGQGGAQQDPFIELGGRTEALWRRVSELERALAVQEWWLYGRALPEARLLSEIGSLLAVARAELESALTQVFGRPAPPAEADDQSGAPGDPASLERDPAWVAALRDQAIGLLRMIAGALPPMLQYAQMLRQYSEHYGLPAAAVDAFSIVGDRLGEVDEALRQPPV